VAERGPERCFKKGAYFIGKTLFAKGLGLLIDYMSEDKSFKHKTIDVYGEGEDAAEIKAAAKALHLKMHFHGRRDHADSSLHGYKVFVNPSRTEVLSTTTAEALAMGKFVVIEKHPSNEFFYQFPNTITYETPDEFRAALDKALSSTPAPMTEAQSRALSWPGATERFLDLIKESSKLAKSPCARDSYARFSHLTLVSGWEGYFGDFLKKYVYQSGPVSRQRWLHADRRYRKSTSVVEIVNKSVAVSPPQTKDDWTARYNAAK
jgi:digalactosyldiacylglycerol synthase